MDPITLLAVALATGLWEVAFKLGEASVDAALEPVKDRLKQRVQRGYKKAEKNKKLLEAVKAALEEAAIPHSDEDDLLAYFKQVGIYRLVADDNQALRQQVARAVLAFTDSQAAPPDDLLLSLRWPRSRAGELSKLLAALRQAFSGLDEWKDVVAYADAAAERDLLRGILEKMADFENAFVNTEAGEALRVAVVDAGLTPEQAARIEGKYRQGLEHEYRMHTVTSLAQVQKAVRLPTEEIYTDLGLLPISSQREREEEQEEMLEMRDSERIQREQQRIEKRISNGLAENRQLVIVGKPGSGKTMSLKFIALMLATGSAGAIRLGLPAPYLPVIVRLADYAMRLKREPDLALETFLMQYIEKNFPGAPRQGEFLQLALDNGACMILLDGLDEVGDIGDTLIHGQTLRSEVLRQVRRFADRRCSEETCNRIIVTSRLEGYQRGDLPGFAEAELSPLRPPEEVEDFLLRWFTAYIQVNDSKLPYELAGQRARRDHVDELMPAILRWDSIRRLAVNPLLLTILAIIHEMGKRLPNRRVELYEVVAKTMIENWRQGQTGHVSEIYSDLRPSDIFYVLASLAYWLHENKPGGTMPNAEWQRKISALLKDAGYEAEAKDLSQRFLRHARTETGLLTERSAGQIGFFHLTLEEYLAAVEMARQETDKRLEMLDQHWQNPRWQEVILLVAGELDQRGARNALETFITRILALETAMPEQEGRPALLAGRALADVGSTSVRSTIAQKVREALCETMQDLDPETHKPIEYGRVPILVRASAADTLDELGWLPEDLYTFVQIRSDDFSRPSRRTTKVVTTNTFWIAKYPVTNAQYKRFLDAPDFGEKEFWVDFPKFDEEAQPMKETWGDAGWEWLRRAQKEEENKVIFPRYWHDPRFGIARQGVPVVGITWWEAHAYCKWLLKHWAELDKKKNGFTPAILRMPTESEWAWAAGGEENERYPWDEGNKATKEDAEILRRANTRESGVNRTTPVDMYPLGASKPYGLYDLAGNVWEWQANYYSNSHSSLALRGGSWDFNRGSARVSVRNFTLPSLRDDVIGFRLVAFPR